MTSTVESDVLLSCFLSCQVGQTFMLGNANLFFFSAFGTAQYYQ